LQTADEVSEWTALVDELGCFALTAAPIDKADTLLEDSRWEDNGLDWGES
jgi:hypothetical protein